MEHKVKILLLLSCLVFFLGSCVTNRNTDLLQDIPKEYMTVKPDEYRIIAGDQLTVMVYSLDEETSGLFRAYSPQFTSSAYNASTESSDMQAREIDNTRGIKPVTVFADGTINFPYIGKIYVQDKTIAEVRKELSDRLNAFAEGTTADIALANRYFSVLGETGARRVLMSGTKMNIYQALSTANTIGTFGDRSKVTILRQTKDGSITKTFDLRSKDVIDSEYYYIQPNDVIYFPQMKRKFFGGTDTLAGTMAIFISLASIIIYSIRLF